MCLPERGLVSHPLLANQSEAPAEHASETSSTPKEIKGKITISPEPPINAADQDLKMQCNY